MPIVTFGAFDLDPTRVNALGRLIRPIVPPVQHRVTEVGFGGRIAHRVSSRVWLEVELDWFETYRRRPQTSDLNYTGGGKLMLLAGPSVRFSTGPITLIARPSAGVTRIGATPELFATSAASGVFPFIEIDSPWIWTFAPGGGVQVAVAPRVALRADVDDLILRSSYRMPDYNVPSTRHNIRETFALVFRY